MSMQSGGLNPSSPHDMSGIKCMVPAGRVRFTGEMGSVNRVVQT